MPREIDGVVYFTLEEAAALAGVSRATIWRWRRKGRIPAGNRLRGRLVIFTSNEIEAIREFALHVEPIAGESIEQLSLFRRSRR